MVSSREEILIIDDQPNNLRLLSTLLTTRGYNVRKAISGTMAIASVLAEPPDLILLDIRMPDMDGYEVCIELKSNPLSAPIPIIFISALDEILDKMKAFSLGGVDYITKPFQSAEVLARVESQLNIQRLQKELTRKNKDLEVLNADLTRSNQELSRFSYVIAHDLQQPLQSITGFSRLINFKYGQNLPRDVVEYLGRIEKAGDRMQKLITGLLSYARLEQGSNDFKSVDCRVIIQQVRDNLYQKIEETKTELEIGELPIVFGNELLLSQLFQNLIGNGMKFVKADRTPRIKLNFKELETEWLFIVEDNGIGIQEDDRERVFEIFQRSNPEYEGNGIGLATCQKIVTLHGGKIWVESVLSEGTTFYFTIAKGRTLND